MHFKGRKHQALLEEDSDEEPRSVFEYAPKLAGPCRPAGLCAQDRRFQMKSATRGLANLSMG